MEKCDRLHAEAALLAGEILLVSGAEIFRIEETIRYILRETGCKAETVVYSTGIFICLRSEEEVCTLVRRVNERATNLDKICRVNEVSRELAEGRIEIEEVYRRLQEIRGLAGCRAVTKELSYIGIACFFAVLLGGTAADCLAAALAGTFLGLAALTALRLGLGDFWVNAAGAFFAGLTAVLLKHFAWSDLNGNIVVIGAIMSLVPGVIFTTAVRDTFYGDYSSGVSRMMEAVVTALAIAVGVGASLSLFELLFEGGYLL